MDTPVLDHRARRLVERLANGCEMQDLGSASVAVYDTAWLSMISKMIDGQSRWLFPECFDFLLRTQLPEGGWERQHGPLDDAILNTMAALLAMKKHSNASNTNNGSDYADLEVRISKATRYLEDQLQEWDVESSMLVGFEILVPAILAMLNRDNICFTFPGQQLLRDLNTTKLGMFDAEVIYGIPTTLLHSLEAFIGTIDFDRVSHQKTFGSMMASPASTAAYLMHSTIWDGEAERYLRNVIDKAQGKGSGGVPSVFPAPIFETTWVVSTLLQNQYSIDTLGNENLNRIAVYLQQNLREQQGLLGFVPSVLADADDSARAILTLKLLGKDASPDNLIKHFKTNNGHFRTYPGERNASFSANCNVLQALLHSSNVELHEALISTITSFLCDTWWSGAIRDKWNVSPQYSMMLLAEALMRILRLRDTGLLKLLPERLLRDRIPVVLIQILNRTLLTQTPTGAWGAHESPEVTAYAVLTLAAVSPLPWIALLNKEVGSAIEAGQRFLCQSSDRWVTPQHLWIEKVTYGSPSLSEAYALAAMRPTRSSCEWSDQTMNLVHVSEESVTKLSHKLSSLQVFYSQPFWRLKASVIEGYLFLPQLELARRDVLPCQKGAKNEYVNYIPCTWVVINNHSDLFLQANLLWDMMVLTICNFRVDEYMETAVPKFSDERLELIRSTIHSICTDVKVNKNLQTKERQHLNSVQNTSKSDHFLKFNRGDSVSELASFEAVISGYVQAMLEYNRIQRASVLDRSHVRSELEAFLLSHITQAQDNARFAAQPNWSASVPVSFSSPSTSYYTWAHTIGANSVSCPFSFAFLTGLLGASFTTTQPTDCFSSVQQKYLAHDLCARLAVMSRLYNDYGSLSRDLAEANINSVNFPEFHALGPVSCLGRRKDEPKVEIGLKMNLLALAQYERGCAHAAAEKLLVELKRGSLHQRKVIADGVILFMGVTALFADLYVMRDLSNQMKKGC